MRFECLENLKKTVPPRKFENWYEKCEIPNLLGDISLRKPRENDETKVGVADAPEASVVS